MCYVLSMPRVLLLTSTFLRHQFFINALCEKLDVVGVWQEEKDFVPEEYAGNDDDKQVIADHFTARDASEEQYFGDHRELRLPDGCVLRKVAAKQVSDTEELELMQSLNPDAVLVFGSSILQEPMIAAFEGNIINLHLGLSPYYRGSGTNFWPLVNGEPEYVGATIHYLDAGIDTGEMICHVRPDAASGDGPHDLGNKTIQAAVSVLPDVVSAHLAGKLQPQPQRKDIGKLYLRKHFTADSVRTLYENLSSGMIETYLQNREERDSVIDLLAPPKHVE